jgi:hypothetical protein
MRLQQLQRLCGLGRTACQMVFDSLVDAWFLCAKLDGHYALLTESEISRPRAAKAHRGLEEESLPCSTSNEEAPWLPREQIAANLPGMKGEARYPLLKKRLED